MTAKLPPQPTPPRVTLTRDHEDAGMEFAHPESPVHYEYLSIEEHNQLLEEKRLERELFEKREEGSWVRTAVDLDAQLDAAQAECARLRKLVEDAMVPLDTITKMPWFSFGAGRFIQDEAATIAGEALAALREGIAGEGGKGDA